MEQLARVTQPFDQLQGAGQHPVGCDVSALPESLDEPFHRPDGVHECPMALLMYVTKAVDRSLHLSSFHLNLPLEHALILSAHFPRLPRRDGGPHTPGAFILYLPGTYVNT